MANGFSKYLGLIALLLCTNFAVAQYAVKATALTHDIKDLSQRDSKIVDQNGEKCALIKFETPISALFTFNLGAQQIEKRENKDDEIWIWVSADVKKMTIRCNDCSPLKDYRVALKPNNVYRAKLTTGLPQETSTHQNINIYCEHTPFYISIDDAEPVLSTQRNYYAELPVGVHDMTVTAKLYKPYSSSFRLLRSKAYTDTVKLLENFGEIIISSNQPDYTVAVDEEQQPGRGIVRVEPGKHKIVVMKDRYESYETEIDIKLHERKPLSVTLKPAFALFTFTTSDEETEIWIDGKQYGRNRVVAELSWGEHNIEGRREGYDTWVYPTHDFNTNSAKSIKIPKLNQQFGTVRLSIFPSDAKLYFDGRFTEFQGNIYVDTRITTGVHYIQIRMPDYKTVRDSFTIYSGKLFARDYALEHISLGEITLHTDPNIGIYRITEDSFPVYLGREAFHGKLPAGEVIIELMNTKKQTCRHRIFVNEGVVNPPVQLPFERKLMVRSNVVGATMQLKSSEGTILTRPNKQLTLAPQIYELTLSRRDYQPLTDTLDLTAPDAVDMIYHTHLFKTEDTVMVYKNKQSVNPIFRQFYDCSGKWFIGVLGFGYTFGIYDFSHVLTFGIASFRYKMLGVNLVDFEFCVADSVANENKPEDFVYRSLCYTPKVSLIVPCTPKFAMTFFGGFSFNVYDSQKRLPTTHRSYVIGGVSMELHQARRFPMNIFAEYRWPMGGEKAPETGQERLFRVGIKFTGGIDF